MSNVDDTADASEASRRAHPYAHLPDPIRIEDTVTSADVSNPSTLADSAARELDRRLRATGGGM